MGLERRSAAGRLGPPLPALRGAATESRAAGGGVSLAGLAAPSPRPASLPLAAVFPPVPPLGLLAAWSRAGKRAGLAARHGWLPLPWRLLLRRGAGVLASLRGCLGEIQR